MKILHYIASQIRKLLFHKLIFFLIPIFFLLLPLSNRLTENEQLISNSTLFNLTQMFMLITLASDWNLISGFTGYVDFGHITFFGLGAYTTGILMSKNGWEFFPTLFVGALIAALFALFIGRITMHLKGAYFSIAMMGTFAAAREIIRVLKPLTGGGPGLTLPPYLNRPLFYYLTLIQVILVVGMIAWLKRAEFGKTLVAIREDETGAETRGINTTLNKMITFALAAFSTAIVGGMWAYQNTFIDPDVVFLDSRNIEIAMTTMLGGMGTVAGPVLGGIILYWLKDYLWANLLHFHLILEGFILILIVLIFPSGVLGALGNKAATGIIAIIRKWFKPDSISDR